MSQTYRYSKDSTCKNQPHLNDTTNIYSNLKDNFLSPMSGLVILIDKWFKTSCFQDAWRYDNLYESRTKGVLSIYPIFNLPEHQ